MGFRRASEQPPPINIQTPPRWLLSPENSAWEQIFFVDFDLFPGASS